MKKDLLEYDLLENDYLEFFLKENLCSALDKMLTIFKYCGYELEKFVNNYYNWLNPLDYHFSNTHLFKIINSNLSEINENKLKQMEILNKNEFIKIMTFFETKGLKIDKFSNNLDSPIEYISCTMDFDKIIKNNAVKSLLLSAMRMYYIDLKNVDPQKYKDSDYTYLMVNYVKSLERFMFYKLNEIKPFNDYEKKT